MLRPTFVIPVFGTHGWEKNDSTAWWRSGSPFLNFLFTLNLLPLFPDRPFMWSGDLDGLLCANGNDWEAGAEAFRWMVEHPLGSLPNGSRNVIAHSHGGQVVLIAAANGVKLNRLITVGTPVRGDLEKVYSAARPNIGSWMHIYDEHWDLWGQLGALGDHRLSLIRANRYAHHNCPVDAISHSKILYDSAHFHLWVDNGWAKFLTE